MSSVQKSTFVPSFIIVGGGSAGCVLASRLTAYDRYSVLLLEAGGSDFNFWVQVPIGYGRAFYHPGLNWMYVTKPDAALNGRKLYWPRGKVIGGSSSINAMVYIRGHADDFDEWEAMGNQGWNWREVLPYFKRSECNDLGEDEFRGGQGPLHVSTMERDLHPLCQNFIRAAIECGFPANPDFNGASQEGVGLYQNTVKNGIRMSAARAYLNPARRRKNLHIETRSHVTRILFEDKRAVGIEYVKRGKRIQVKAGREVILCAGAVNSPQLLQLSGIGSSRMLKSHNIDVICERNGVGENLQDHLGIDYLYRSLVPTLNNQLHPIWGKMWQGFRYLLNRRGPLSLGVNQGGGFVRTQSHLKKPNMQLFFSPVSYTKAPPGKRPLMNPDHFPGFLLGIQPTRPVSRGRIELESDNPFSSPAIYPNYLSDDADIQEMLEGAKLIRKLAAAPSLSSIIDKELLPGSDVQSDQELIEDIRERSTTVFHPVGTCRMGPNVSTDVIDHQLKVYGVDALRVVDASIFPTLTSGNTNAPTIMVAEKASDLIIQSHMQN